jgi:hypothetical protein
MSRRVAPEGEAPCTPGAFPTGEPSLTWRDAPEDAPLTTSARWKSVAPEGEAVAFPDSGEPYVTWRDAPEESLRPKSFGASRSSISTASELIQESGAGKIVASSSNFTPAIVSAALFASIPLGAGQSIGFWDSGHRC